LANSAKTAEKPKRSTKVVMDAFSPQLLQKLPVTLKVPDKENGSSPKEKRKSSGKK